MRRPLTLLAGLLFIIPSFARAQSLTDTSLLACIQSFNSSAISSAGRESAAASMLKHYFPPGAVKQDRLGNLVITIGSGNPRRLLSTSLDEPAYVISNIQPDGYCRVTPIGTSAAEITHQFIPGNPVLIQTSTGPQYAVAITPSTHFDGLRQIREDKKPVHTWQETILDLGCSNAEEVAARGIRLFDPVTTWKTTQIIGQPGLPAYSIAGPNIRVKSAVVALVGVARTLLQSKFTGTVTIAFTVLDDINGKGLEDVRNKYGPFDETARFGNDVQLQASFAKTPVEKVQAAAIRQLITDWLDKVDKRAWEPVDMQPLPILVPPHVITEFVKEDDLLSDLVSRYGVSGSEAPVRDYILSSLPAWAHPVTDEKGNILVTFGKGQQHIAFVAHMDEVGYAVDSILEDGTLRLTRRGGFNNFIWEGHAAIIHTALRQIPALFEPRPDYLSTTMEITGSKYLIANAGFTNKQAALDAGIRENFTTVTMPKQLFRLSANKAAARGFDDRVGCAALLLVLHHIDPETLPFKVTIVFSTGEEIGLLGSTFAAKGLQDCDIVYPIDTFVSSDDPVEPHSFAYCPLGKGAVIRVIESINIARKADVDYLQQLAAHHNIAIQLGMTAGGTDGQGFLAYDIPSVPLSWPGRYSHSPIEVMDFRDLRELVALIQTIMQDKTKEY
jgi:putative aminopeptidase